MTTVAILGANGVYARHLIPRLVRAGHRVVALARRPEAAAVARACGAEVRRADIFDRASLVAALDGAQIGINLATSLPGPSGRGDFAANDHLRIAGTRHWVSACREAKVGRIVQQSIGLVNASTTDAWTDEDHAHPGPIDPPVAAEAIAACRIMEGEVLGSGLPAMILRGGLFYGPGTGFDDGWFAAAATGRLRTPGDGAGHVSLVHIADMAEATLRAVERFEADARLIVCDDEPVRWRDLFAYIAALAGQEDLPAGGRAGFPSFRLRNGRARERLGWAPLYTSYREGLVR